MTKKIKTFLKDTVKKIKDAIDKWGDHDDFGVA